MTRDAPTAGSLLQESLAASDDAAVTGGLHRQWDIVIMETGGRAVNAAIEPHRGPGREHAHGAGPSSVAEVLDRHGTHPAFPLSVRAGPPRPPR